MLLLAKLEVLKICGVIPGSLVSLHIYSNHRGFIKSLEQFFFPFSMANLGTLTSSGTKVGKLLPMVKMQSVLSSFIAQELRILFYIYLKGLYKTSQEKCDRDYIWSTKFKIFIFWILQKKKKKLCSLLQKAEKWVFKNCYAKEHQFKSAVYLRHPPNSQYP